MEGVVYTMAFHCQLPLHNFAYHFPFHVQIVPGSKTMGGGSSLHLTETSSIGHVVYLFQELKIGFFSLKVRTV